MRRNRQGDRPSEKMIEHLQDPGTLEAANKLIEEMEAKKVQLHCEPEK